MNLNASGLTGTITSDISKLTQLKELDLSSNDLSGEIPAFFADMKLLKLIVFLLIQRNLSGNPKLNLTVPESLQERSGRSPKSQDSWRKKVPVLAIAVPVVGVFALVVILAIFFIVRKKRPRSNAGISKTSISHYKFMYHGNLDDAQVAVKMLSHSSAQGYKEFKAEVELLLRVHHRHLVGLVGYCDDGDNLALIYEYMANGDLRENMSGKRGGNVLTWENRMQIAVEAAQGLEYLHNGCRPPMVHRDVKTTNILLNDRSGAKLADFGLSRSFSIDGECHVSTVVAGTPGYLDPEYYRTNWLSEKSDVYSFRVVLLEIVTNQPVIDKTRERPHINEWVGYFNLYYCMHPWKKKSGFSSGCVNPSSNQRPTMVQVVMELNECVALEIARRQGSQEMYSMGSVVTLVSLLLQSLPREPDNLKIYSDFAHLPGFTSSFGKFSNRENHIYFPPPLWLNPRRVQPTTTSEGPPLLPEDHIMKANLTLAGENRACSFLPTLGPFYLRYPLIRHLHHQVSELSTPDSMASRFSTAEKGPRHPYHVNDDRRIRHFKPSVDRDFRNDRRAVYADYRRRPPVSPPRITETANREVWVPHKDHSSDSAAASDPRGSGRLSVRTARQHSASHTSHTPPPRHQREPIRTPPGTGSARTNSKDRRPALERISPVGDRPFNDKMGASDSKLSHTELSPICSLSEDRLHVSMRLGPVPAEPEATITLPMGPPPKRSGRIAAKVLGKRKPPTQTPKKRVDTSPVQGTSIKRRRITKIQGSPKRKLVLSTDGSKADDIKIDVLYSSCNIIDTFICTKKTSFFASFIYGLEGKLSNGQKNKTSKAVRRSKKRNKH
ncbi:LOW QUALITY PROTEIN: hypothetical protein HID58_070493 [Brassica napus]|uniref:Protein kinase domain-containing protein n=1 Tax=Brassica napus TaxID=3708 RepID=A0ABQ7YYX7_BRANA|nr:LOW QUALITY PROTEIN: hypothetical protein HID58_070493 [Brassica napus]